MRRHADVVQMLEDIFRDPVVEDALALDDLVLLGVERGGVVLEMLDQSARLRSLVEGFGLAFVNATPTSHWDVPCVVEVHEWGAPDDYATRSGAAAKPEFEKQTANRTHR